MTERVMNEIQASKDEKKVIAEELDTILFVLFLTYFTP